MPVRDRPGLSPWITMPRLEELVSATPPAIRFLESYVNGARGYTRQDVRAGIKRLEVLCKALAEVDYPSVLAQQRTDQLRNTAEDMLGRARDRLNEVVPG
jgi:hypothetical protein